MKKALITGITGQDGSYLAELLLLKGYEVHGLIRRASTSNILRIKNIYQNPHDENINKVFLHHGDLSDAGSIRKSILNIQPDEIYNLAAQSHVKISFEKPEYTANITALGALRILDAIKDSQDIIGKKIKFYQASSSEMFGSAPAPQNEKTPFYPRSPYACAKVFAHHTTVNYRDAHGIFAVSGILFNHESPRRGENFVTKKITRGIARIIAGLDKKLYLGNLDSRRDWGYAKEYMEAVWLMLQQPEPDDYIIGTGETHSVKEFVEAAFKYAGINNWQDYIEISAHYLRPTEVDHLIADVSKAKEKLGWETKTKFDDLVKIMVESDLEEYGVKK